MSRVIVCILIIFLLFPKVGITDRKGILIGEIVLILFGPILAITVGSKDRFKVSSTLLLFWVLCICLMLLSSVIGGLKYQIIPFLSFFYFSRIVLFATIFFLIRYISNRYDQDYIVKYIFIWPFIFHFIITIGIVIHYFLTHNPSLNQIMWGYDVGIRQLPLSGLTIDPSSEYFLIAKRGSHNIIASWAILILLIAITYPGRIKYRRWLLLITTITPFLSMSRAKSTTGTVPGIRAGARTAAGDPRGESTLRRPARHKHPSLGALET